MGLFASTLQNAWLRRGWIACALWPVSLLYGMLAALQRLFYRAGLAQSTACGVGTVVVGNVIAGGGGKTPLVIALAEHLSRKGVKVGLISRGYGRSGDDCLEVTSGMPAAQAGDEPLLLKRRTGLPVFVARRRADAAHRLLQAYPATQLLICDDGLQHHALQRDIEIVVFDDRGTGNGWLLPAGPLREPWPLRRRAANPLVLHTGRHPAFAGFRSTRELAGHAVAHDGRQVGFGELRGRKLVALAAIANPQSFFDMLRDCGIVLEKTIGLPDHHDFGGCDFAGCKGATVLCTEKDAVKLFAQTRPSGVELLAVPLCFAPEQAFLDAFDQRLDKLL